MTSHRGTEKKRLRLQYFEELHVRRFGFQKGRHTAVECDKHTSPSQRERQQISIRHLLVAHQPPAKKRDIRPRQFVPFSRAGGSGGVRRDSIRLNRIAAKGRSRFAPWATANRCYFEVTETATNGEKLLEVS